jgi:hypothetical protein
MAPRGEGEVANPSRSPGACLGAKTADTEHSNTTLLLSFQNIHLNPVFELRLYLPVSHGSSHYVEGSRNTASRNGSTTSSEMQDFRDTVDIETMRADPRTQQASLNLPIT